MKKPLVLLVLTALVASVWAWTAAHAPFPTASDRLTAPLKRLLAPPSLVWDAELKEQTVLPGRQSAEFIFVVTNVSTRPVIINKVHTSCGCTVAKLPGLPWELVPGTNLPIQVTLNLRGKLGTITKKVTVETSDGRKELRVRVHIPERETADQPNEKRSRNQEVAAADRQAVFKGDCARCHAEPTAGRLGQPLYAAACGICHDSPERASAVPDLRAVAHSTDETFWRQWVAYGKPGSMMPAFAQAEGGPLSDTQINSLVKYLAARGSQ
jgi:cytochrome c553